MRKGTIFEESRLPLRKWFAASWLVTTNRKGIASTQLAREIEVTQKTAWFMLDRLREVAAALGVTGGPMSGQVEADETYIGGEEPLHIPLSPDALLQAAVNRVPRSMMEPWLNKVHQGDCVQLMNKMPAGSIDLIVTSREQEGGTGMLLLETGTQYGFIGALMAVIVGLLGILFTVWLRSSGSAKNGAVDIDATKSGEMATGYWLQQFAALHAKSDAFGARMEGFGAKIEASTVEIGKLNNTFISELRDLKEALTDAIERLDSRRPARATISSKTKSP